mgnify:CR=1 FL=1
MGPSGCGKSMMMDVLAGRRTRGKINGVINYAGTTPTEMFLRRITGYVEQFGTLIENLTVYEMLMYTAELKVRFLPFEIDEIVSLEAVVGELPVKEEFGE